MKHQLKHQVQLLLSFDHELSLGGTSSYQGNLFEPTDRLLDLADELQVPVTLFTDVLCAMRFRDWDAEGFYDPWRCQIERAMAGHHDVQLHLHPHWLDSTYEQGAFVPAKTFALGDFAEREWPNNIPGIVANATDFLSGVCQRQWDNYKCVAFRAGGYNLAPATSQIVSALLDNGIRIDSSIAKGMYFKSGISEVNFRDMPSSPNWHISADGNLRGNNKTGLYEIPIVSKPRTPLNNMPFLCKRILLKKRAHSTGKAIHSGNTSRREKLSRIFPRSVWMLSFDNYTDSVSDLLRILQHYIKSHSDSEQIICSAISHPKSMGTHSFKLIRNFVNEVRQRYADAIQFRTFRQIYDDLCLHDMS